MVIYTSVIVPAIRSDGKVCPDFSSFHNLYIYFCCYYYSCSFFSLGENVSTNEVEAVIQKVVKLSDCVVFGVSIQNCDGKAGMAVIADPNQTINMDYLYEECHKRLPIFAIPLFVRITSQIELTGSFKLSKTSLEKDGFDPSKIKDRIYFLDRKMQTYVPMDYQLYEDVQSGRLML